MDIKVIVATHKEYKMPEDKIYLPLFVGAALKDENACPDYTRDDSGENISEKNPYFCELTGLYWGWKNLEYDYLGLVHYRRYFGERKKCLLSEARANELLTEYRVIVPRKRRYYIETLYSHYKHTHYIETLDKAGAIISESYPQYYNAFRRVCKKRSGYMFNMFIMSKDMLDEYCEWLFNILFNLEDSLNGMNNNLSAFQSRFYGRVSEILFNVWIQYHLDNKDIKKEEIKALPVVFTEKVKWVKKVNAFLAAKFLHKKYEGSF